MGIFSKKEKKNLEKKFGKQEAIKIIEEWDRAGEIMYNEKVERALIEMRDDVVEKIAKLKEQDLSVDLKQKKIIQYVMKKLKENKVIEVKFKDELEKKERFKITLNTWSDAIKKVWQFKDKLVGAKAALIYCYDWQNKFCNLIPLETNEAIFLHQENRELFYLSNPFLEIDGKPIYFVLRGLMFSYRMRINIDRLDNYLNNKNLEDVPMDFIVELGQAGSRPMYTMFKAAVLDRFSGEPRNWKDKLKTHIVSFLLGGMTVAIFLMPMIEW
ncbi:MAG: hypothetical protein ACOC1P_03280 [Minisyncoccales bacterium]